MSKFIVFDPTDGNHDEFDTEVEARARAVEISIWLLNQQYAIQVALCDYNEDGSQSWSPYQFIDPIKVI
jgi:hypothetical protein